QAVTVGSDVEITQRILNKNVYVIVGQCGSRCISFSDMAKTHQSGVVIIDAFLISAYPNNIIRVFVERINGIMRKAPALFRIMHHIVYRSLLLMDYIYSPMISAGPNLAFSMLY